MAGNTVWSPIALTCIYEDIHSLTLTLTCIWVYTKMANKFSVSPKLPTATSKMTHELQRPTSQVETEINGKNSVGRFDQAEGHLDVTVDPSGPGLWVILVHGTFWSFVLLSTLLWSRCKAYCTSVLGPIGHLSTSWLLSHTTYTSHTPNETFHHYNHRSTF